MKTVTYQSYVETKGGLFQIGEAATRAEAARQRTAAMQSSHDKGKESSGRSLTYRSIDGKQEPRPYRIERGWGGSVR